MSPLTEAREAVTDALAGVGYTVHPAVPETITPPCAWIQARDPWTEPATLGATRVNLTVGIAVTLTKGINNAILTDLEDRIWEAITALRTAGNILVGNATYPEPANDNRNVATSTIEVAVHVTD